MSEATIDEARVPEGSPGWMSWRDAIVPTGRASRRRWVVFYAVLLVAAAAQAGWGDLFGISENGGGWALSSVVLLFIVFGMLRRSTRWLTAPDHPELDERDRLALASAYRLAYPLLTLALLAGAGVLGAMLASGEKIAADVVLTGLGVWGLVWAVSLPTAALAWREPDAVLDEWQENTGQGGPSERTRDAILMLAFGATLALDAFVERSPGIWLLIATLCVVAVWVRRGAGQQAISSHIGGVGIVLFILGLPVPIFALVEPGSGITASGVIISLVSATIGLAILVAERRERHI